MSYDEHLDRAMSESDSSGSAGRFSVPDPELRADGSFTVFENFASVAERLGRAPDHVMQYLQSELGTAASRDDADRLRLTGSFKQRRVVAALEEYADGYVLCPECGLPDTKLVEEGEFRQCEACGERTRVGA
ncbi:translation initiation factor IF-2 subunit beta [Halosegnis marinus]|uniref:Translation initiation factor IF-2 subunit beta n=1 Tax=Halosegnis marinus TaxID=3034023 RepID=A0ABD5ZKU7_9EURY|nr:translation initiation factor IF-2 subunit beta [Halosegnis sp. DT85]